VDYYQGMDNQKLQNALEVENYQFEILMGILMGLALISFAIPIYILFEWLVYKVKERKMRDPANWRMPNSNWEEYSQFYKTNYYQKKHLYPPAYQSVMNTLQPNVIA
jgi:hypothetical protein